MISCVSGSWFRAQRSGIRGQGAETEEKRKEERAKSNGQGSGLQVTKVS